MFKTVILALTASAAVNAAAVPGQSLELVRRVVPEASAAENNAAGAGLGGFPTLAQSGCEDKCKPWLQVINSDPCFTSETCPNDQLMQTGKRICENLNNIAACGYCNAAEARDEVAAAIKKTFDACQAAYGVPAKLPEAPEVKQVETSSVQSVKAAETSKAADTKESQTSKASEAPKASESAKAADASKQEKSGAVARTATVAAIAVGFAVALMA